MAGVAVGDWHLRYVRRRDLASRQGPEAARLDMVCRSLSIMLDDDEVLAVTGPMFDGLYEFGRRALLLGRDPA